MKLSGRLKLVSDINRIRDSAFGYKDITTKVNKTKLELERNFIIRGTVLSDCLMLEEAMSLIIMDYILKDSARWRKIIFFGRIKSYNLLYDDILSHIPPFQKLSILKKFIAISSNIEKTMRKIFDMRNSFSHVFTIDYNVMPRLQYKGKSIFEVDTFEQYTKDAKTALGFLLKKIKV